MPSIVVDIAAYQRRVGTIPPKSGAVKADFMISDVLYSVTGSSFKEAVNAAKRTARKLKVYAITLENITK